MAPTPLLKVGYNVHTRCMHLQMKPCAHDDELYLREEFEDTGLQLTEVIELTCMAGAHKLYH